MGGHFFPGAAIDDGHGGAVAPGGAGHVQGDVAAADHRHPFAHLDFLAQIVAAQELHPLHDPFQVLARNSQRPPLVTADAQEHGLVALVKQVIQGEVLPQGHIES